jgi:hypothetical protein
MTPTTRMRNNLRPGRPANPDTAAEGGATLSDLERPSTKRIKPLRRWSVAELVARGAPRPPRTA